MSSFKVLNYDFDFNRMKDFSIDNRSLQRYW